MLVRFITSLATVELNYDGGALSRQCIRQLRADAGMATLAADG